MLLVHAAAAQPLARDPDATLRPLPTGVRPERASRVVALFDFEERLTNPLEVPEGWVRGQSDPAIGRDRPGFPRFNRAQLDYEAPALKGEGSVRVEARGGSGSLLLRPGVIPIFPGADYMVIASVRTENTQHARAVIAARLLDQNLQPIEGSESRSEPVSSPGVWTRLRTPVLGDFDNAAYLQLELLLLQPDQLDPDARDEPFHIEREDFDARAWFDEVGVVALPRIEIHTADRSGVVVAPARPSFELLVRDLTGERLRVDAVIVDALGREVDRTSRQLPGGRFIERWTPRLDELGWYTARLEVRVDQTLVGSAETAFAWTPPLRRPDRVRDGPDALPSLLEDWEQFALLIPFVDDAAIDSLVPLVRASGVGAVTLAAWGHTDDQAKQDRHLRRLAPEIDALLDQWLSLTLSLARVPPEMARAQNLEQHDVLALLAGDPSVWEPALTPLLDRFGQRIRGWQIGVPTTDAPLEPADLRDSLERVEQALSDMIPGPLIDIPWRSDDPIDPVAASWGRNITMLAIPGTAPDAYAQLREDWDRARALAPPAPGADPADRPGLTLAIEPIDPQRFGPRASAAEFVRHAVMFWASFAPEYSSEGDAPPRTTLALCEPWTIERGRRPRAAPVPAYPALRALIDRLSGRRVRRALTSHPGVHALLLEPTDASIAGDKGAIVLWTDRAETATFELFLGDMPISRVDIFGNHTPIEPDTIPTLNIPVHRIELSREPVFLEGVDTTLVSFLAALELTPDTLTSSGELHEASLTIENPWRVPIRGAVYIVEPGGYSNPDADIDRSWRISPRKIPFRLNPGQSRQYPVNIAFSLAEEAGEKRVVMDVQLIAERDHGLVRTDQPLHVGLPGIELDVSAQRARAPDGAEFVALDLIVTNNRAEPISFDLVAVAPGRPRERSSVAQLAPGEISARTIAFEYAPDLNDARIAVSLVLPDDQGRLNKSVTID